MKKAIIILTMIALGLTACSSPGGNTAVPQKETESQLPTAEPMDPEQESGDSDADGPKATSATTPAEIPGGDQEQLKGVWRPAYTLGALLYETCTMTYNTHADYEQGIIGLDRAQVELNAESDFVEYVMLGITSTMPESEEVAAHILGIEDQLNALVEWLGTEDLGADGALEAIERSCVSLQNRMDQIYSQSQAAGLSSAALDELDSEISPMIEDLFDQTWFGR